MNAHVLFISVSLLRFPNRLIDADKFGKKIVKDPGSNIGYI